MIELDVRFSRDKSLVVFHDRRLDRTTNGKGPVNALTLNQLRELDAGSWFSQNFKGEKILTLKEVIEFISPSEIKLCIELKIDQGEELIREELVSRVIEIIDRMHFHKRAFPASFDKECSRLSKKFMPALPFGLIFSEEKIWEESIASGFENIDYLSARWNIVTSTRVQKAHQAGRKVIAWTIDREKELDEMVKCKVDVVASNNPAWLIETLREKGY